MTRKKREHAVSNKSIPVVFMQYRLLPFREVATKCYSKSVSKLVFERQLFVRWRAGICEGNFLKTGVVLARAGPRREKARTVTYTSCPAWMGPAGSDMSQARPVARTGPVLTTDWNRAVFADQSLVFNAHERALMKKVGISSHKSNHTKSTGRYF